MLVACGGPEAPAESPATDAPEAAEEAAPADEVESEPAATSEGEAGDEAAPESTVDQQELPCPGKKARYWDSGLVKSFVLTSDCGINGLSFKAGTLVEFDEDGQLLSTP
jgi:hypothetical protein